MSQVVDQKGYPLSDQVAMFSRNAKSRAQTINSPQIHSKSNEESLSLSHQNRETVYLPQTVHERFLRC